MLLIKNNCSQHWILKVLGNIGKCDSMEQNKSIMMFLVFEPEKSVHCTKCENCKIELGAKKKQNNFYD